MNENRVKIKISPSLYDKFREMHVPNYIMDNYEVDPKKPRIEHNKNEFKEVQGEDEVCPF